MRIMIMIMMEPRAAAGFTHSLCNYYIMPYTLIMAGGEWDHSNIPFHIIMLQSTAHPFTPTLSRFIILGLLLRTVWMTNYSEIYVDIYPLKTHTSCFMVVHDATSILLIPHLMSACSMSYLIWSNLSSLPFTVNYQKYYLIGRLTEWRRHEERTCHFMRFTGLNGENT